MEASDFKKFFTAVVAPLLVLDRNFCIVAANPAYCKLTKIVLNDCIGRTVFEVFPHNPGDDSVSGPRDLKTSLLKVINKKVTDEMPVIRYDIRSPDSDEFIEKFWKATNTPVFDSQGEVEFVLHTADDVTEVVQAQYTNTKLQIGQHEISALRIMQSALRESQFELQKVIDLSPVPTVVFKGPEHIYAMTNPAHENLIGRNVRGLPLEEVYSENERAEVKAILNSVYDTGQQYFADEVPYQMYSKGEAISESWLNLSFHPITRTDGKVSAVLTVAQDVSAQVIARKKAEESEHRLRETQEQLKLALDSAKLGVWHVDLINNVVTTSEGAANILGLKDVNASVVDVISHNVFAEDQEKVRSAWNQAVKNNTPYNVDYRVLRHEGEIIWCFSRGETQFDKSGRAVAFVGVLGDITERREAQHELEAAFKQTEIEAVRADRERAKFEAAFHAVAEGIFIFDSDGNPVFMNEGAAKVFGAKTLAEVTQGFEYYFERLDLYEMNGEFIPLSEWPVAKVLRGESFRNWVIKAHRRDTDDHWIWSSSGELAKQKDSNTSLAVVVLRDVTSDIKAQAELEEAKAEADRANQLKSAFLANMSHEIRTPLGAILGFSNLLKDKSIDLKQKDGYLDTIIRSGNSLTKIIDDILDLAKVEAGKLEIETVSFSLLTLLNDAMELFRDKAREKGIYLVCNIAESVPKQIFSDPTRLRQILVNLIGNAVKFTEKGGIKINLRSETYDSSTKRILIDVEDTGMGLSKDQSERLFKPFSQGDNSTTRKFGGTGLGLALSQRLSRALSGDISITYCEPGLGSTFTLSFLAEADDAPKSVAEPILINKPVSSLDGMRVLVADDSPDNLYLVESFLTKYGATVETAEDGQEAFEKASISDFDVILMDIQMPRMDGYQAKAELDRIQYPKPVVALTAHAMKEERVKTQQAGFAGHLTKPLVPSELLSTVASFQSRPLN